MLLFFHLSKYDVNYSIRINCAKLKTKYFIAKLQAERYLVKADANNCIHSVTNYNK